MSRKDQIEELLQDDPENSFLRYGLAMEYVSVGDDAQAVFAFQEVIRRDADYVPAYLQAGRALIRMGRDDEAKEVLRQGISVAQKVGDAHAAGEMSGFLQSLG
ncbi:MAG: tetratricopeptide repeat protein [Planctomycetia bacterium]|nr:tetratricopeptide repeat protein [Planctomycetia bacterium]